MNDVIPNPFKMMMYKIEPEDRTIYRFQITQLCTDCDTIFSGINGIAEDFVLVSTTMEIGGCTLVSLPNLTHDIDCGELSHSVGYAMGHGFQKLSEYTVYAILLAVRVLAFKPYSVDEAAKAMLRVPALMKT